MSQVVKSSTNGKSTSELQVLFKFPVLDCGCHPRVTKGPVLDSTARISVHVKYSTKKPAKAISPNKKFGGGELNIKQRVLDHVWSRETCARNGCKECCGSATQQSKCDKCAEDNIFVLTKKIHEASLHDWVGIERGEGDGNIEANVEIITHDMAVSDLQQEPATTVEQENFEIVDGIVEMQLVEGRVVNVWKDTMLMEDCGY